MAETRKKDRLPNRAGKSPERESGNERITVDGQQKRQIKRTELCGAGMEIPHEPADDKAVCGVAAETGVHIK